MHFISNKSQMLHNGQFTNGKWDIYITYITSIYYFPDPVGYAFWFLTHCRLAASLSQLRKHPLTKTDIHLCLLTLNDFHWRPRVHRHPWLDIHWRPLDDVDWHMLTLIGMHNYPLKAVGFWVLVSMAPLMLKIAFCLCHPAILMGNRNCQKLRNIYMKGLLCKQFNKVSTPEPWMLH